WDAQIAFWSDPKNAARCAQNARNQEKRTIICRQGSRSLVVLRDVQMESSETREYPSLIHTYFDTHTVDDIFLRDEERLLYGRDVHMSPEPQCTHTADFNELLTQLQSQHEVDSGGRSSEGEDDELGDDEDASEDEEDEDS
ncbi:hypothetical protein Tco_0640758, partial [Tanacetum coccineum]